MIAVTFSGNYYVGGGIGYDINLGYVKDEGLFSNLTLKPGPGVDISYGFALTIGDYLGKGNPTANSLKGPGTHASLSLFGIEISEGRDIQTGAVGDNWRINNFGGSFGSSSIAGGSFGVSYTIPFFSKIK